MLFCIVNAVKGMVINMKNISKKIVFSLSSVIIIFTLVLGLGLVLSPNRELEIDEIKAYFRPTVSLDFQPDFENVIKIVIDGKVYMPYCDTYEKGNAVYKTKVHIEQITNYLNELKLVEAQKEELPNKSPDYFIYYYDKSDVIKRFVIYGDVFIEDLEDKKLYRVKNTKSGIITGLENLKLN